jgi:hypothetical protein
MMVHTNIMVVDEPRVVLPGILFVPYVHDPAEFVQICQQYPEAKTVVCHQTFAGSYFENGFLTPDGVEPNLLPQEQVISGHVHSPQRIGKVWYPGAPRWRTVSDANTERASGWSSTAWTAVSWGPSLSRPPGSAGPSTP